MIKIGKETLFCTGTLKYVRGMWKAQRQKLILDDFQLSKHYMDIISNNILERKLNPSKDRIDISKLFRNKKITVIMEE